MIGKTAVLVVAMVLIAACNGGESTEDSTNGIATVGSDAAQRIGADGILRDVKELSDDRYEGRGPGSAGDRLAREYIARRLEEIGFSAAGDGGSWEQPIEIVGLTADPPPTWSFAARSGGGDPISFKWWDDYIAAAGSQQPRAAIEAAEVVFVGYGITAPEESWDDFKGVDLRGKVLLMLNNDPDWDPELFGGERRLYYGRWTYKYEAAARQGAAAAIIIHTDASAGYPWQVVQTSWSGTQFELPSGDEPRIQIPAWLTEDAARRLVALGGRNLDELRAAAREREFSPVALGVATSIGFDIAVEPDRTANVLGMLRGSDSALAEEWVVYTAHHDHLGVGEADDRGDTIYNGALDNAAGVAQILSVAEAFAALPAPPRRSIMMLAVAAEEQGLLGSRYYTLHPTAHPGRIAANINIDGGNIWGRTRDVAVVGRGKSNLEQLLERAAQGQGRVVTDEPFPDKGYYYRSDQFNFARIGVPALYFKSGTDYIGRPEGWGEEQINDWRTTRYHQPSDEIHGDWNLEGMVEDTRLAFLVGLAVANADALPVWNSGDEFEATRNRAIAARPRPETGFSP